MAILFRVAKRKARASSGGGGGARVVLVCKRTSVCVRVRVRVQDYVWVRLFEIEKPKSIGQLQLQGRQVATFFSLLFFDRAVLRRWRKSMEGRPNRG